MKDKFKKLQKENDKIRKRISSVMYENNIFEYANSNLWTLINKLIENELEQEKECNK